jgi:hypothetical protein
MADFRVPTIALEAHLRYFDERPLVGRVFLPSHAQRHDGPMRADEWINQSSQFFPFVAEGDEGARILNKRYVVVLTLPEDPDEQHVGARVRAHVECGTLELEGTVFIEMPEHASRLLDWVNQPELFLVLHEDGKQHIVQKNRITAVREVREN